MNGKDLDNLSLSKQEMEQIQLINESVPSGPQTDFSADGLQVPESNINPVALEEENIEITESYFAPEKIVSIEDDKPVDYKSATQIFYKQDCLPSESNCNRSGAVLTNIKSVIFNYAHSRGSFAEQK